MAPTILDRYPQIGDAWRNRWDSLRVFTPAKYDGLPGMRFPAPRLSFPTKDQVADYMAAYAAKFKLPVRNGVDVESIKRGGGRFVLSTSAGTFEADNVIVATGARHTPKTPAFSSELSTEITQIHSSAYKNPGQLRDGAALVVGVGNSGSEISYDLRNGRHVYLSGSPTAEMPGSGGAMAAAFLLPVLKFVGTHLLTLDTPMGRKVLPKMRTHATPLIRLKLKDLEASGIERVARVTGVSEGRPVLADGRTLDVTNVIWCTGFRSNFGWIDVPDAFGPDGRPMEYRGVVASQPGLYFVGLDFQYSAVSDVLPGVGRDAAYVVKQLVGRPVLNRVDAEHGMVRRDAAELIVG